MATSSKNTGVFNNLLVLHKAMLVGQVIFALVAFYLVYTNTFTQSFRHLDRILQVLAIIFSAGGFYAGSFLFKKRVLAVLENQADPKEKLMSYRRACMLQWSLIEGPCLFVIVCFLLTGNYAFLALAVVLLMLFALMAPSKSKIAIQLQISEAEAGEL